METLPQPLVRSTAVDLVGRSHEVWFRRVGLLILTAFLVAGLVGVFGQTGESASASSGATELRVDASGALRSGLVYQARIEIRAGRTLRVPTLLLEDGWFEGMTVNTISPPPVVQLERSGFQILTFDTLPAGDSLSVRLQIQVNPTTVGLRGQDVILEDNGRRLLAIHRSVVVFP